MEQTRTRAGFAVRELRFLSESAFVLRFDKGALDFAPGQYLSVGPADDINMREYSVYSGPSEDYLEILVKRVDGGYVSNRLATLQGGDSVTVDGPFGFFTIDDDWRDHSFVFIATGTGISPFHAFVRSYPGLDYTLLHGVRTASELYEHATYDGKRVVSCITGEATGDFHGRVTDYLRSNAIDTAARYYLCGNCDMIYEAFDILQDAGVPHNSLFAEVYF
ncbi:MAG: FAD-binding oxidoreductase [Spirochaetales bacterium]|nr:FAD-binding oxidoreductase [Spirochaetales bacterium]